ncbi:hypothetical protein CL621_01140 [archaeon]|nr:hypothetical protein [archaeon]
MSKKKEYMSFIEDGIRYLQCKYCHEYQTVSFETVAITCSRCTAIRSIQLNPELIPELNPKLKRSGRPPGWHFMKIFVDKNGNVFHKGKEQSELKGTLPSTKIKPRKKKTKKTADERLFELAAKYKKKKKKNK